MPIFSPGEAAIAEQPKDTMAPLRELTGATDEFFQSPEWLGATSEERKAHVNRIMDVYDTILPQVQPDINPDQFQSIVGSASSLLRQKLAESEEPPLFEGTLSGEAYKAADELLQTRKLATEPAPLTTDDESRAMDEQMRRFSRESFPSEKREFALKTGLRPEQVDRLLDDQETIESLTDKAAVLKFTGEVAVPPQLAIDKEQWDSAVDATDADPKKKEKAKAMRTKVRDRIADKVSVTLATADPMWDKWNADMAGEMKDASNGEKVERFLKWRKANGGKPAAIMQSITQNLANIGQQIYGAVAGITGSEGAMELAAGAGAIAGASAQAREIYGGAGVTGLAADVLGGVAPSVALSPLARLATTAAGSLRVMAGVGAVQSYGGTMAEAARAYQEQGLTPKDARQKAQFPALVSALSTYILAKIMPRGVESAGQIKAGKEAAKSSFRAYLGEAAKDFTDEALEEAMDQAAQEFTAKLTYDPNRDMGAMVSNLIHAGLIGGIGGTVVGGAVRYSQAVMDKKAAAAKMREDGFPMAAKEMERAAELQAMAEWTQANEGPITAEGAYGRKTDVYDAFGNVQKKGGESDAIQEQETGGMGLREQATVGEGVGGENRPETTAESRAETEEVTQPETKEGEPSEEAQSVPALQTPAEDVRLPEAQVEPPAAPPSEPEPAAAKPVEQPAKSIADAEYDAARETWKAASKEHTRITKAFRAKEISADEFAAGRKAFNDAQEAFDAAETKYIAAKNRETTQGASKPTQQPLLEVPKTPRKLGDLAGYRDALRRVIEKQSKAIDEIPVERQDLADTAQERLNSLEKKLAEVEAKMMPKPEAKPVEQMTPEGNVRLLKDAASGNMDADSAIRDRLVPPQSATPEQIGASRDLAARLWPELVDAFPEGNEWQKAIHDWIRTGKEIPRFAFNDLTRRIRKASSQATTAPPRSTGGPRLEATPKGDNVLITGLKRPGIGEGGITPRGGISEPPVVAFPTSAEIASSRVFETPSGTIVLTEADILNEAAKQFGREAVDDAIKSPMPGSNPMAEMIDAVASQNGWTFAGDIQTARIGKFADTRSELLHGEFKKPGTVALMKDLEGLPERQKKAEQIKKQQQAEKDAAKEEEARAERERRSEKYKESERLRLRREAIARGDKPAAQAPAQGVKEPWRGTATFETYDEPSGKWEPQRRPIVVSKSTIPGDKPWRATVFAGSEDSPVAIGHVQMDSSELTPKAIAELSEQLGRYTRNLVASQEPAKPAAQAPAKGAKAMMGEHVIVKDWTELTEQENPPLDRDLTDYSKWRRDIAVRLLPDGTNIEREAVQMELLNAISAETAKKNPDGKPKYDQWQTHIVGQRIAGELLTGKRQDIIRKAKERALNNEYAQWDMAMEWLEDKPAPLSVEAHKKYSKGRPLPKGFAKEGRFYMFKPTPAPSPAPVVAKRKRGPRDDFGGDSTPVAAFIINDLGGMMSKNSAKKNGLLPRHNDQWEAAPKWSDPTHNKIYNPNSQNTPSTVASRLHDAGLLNDGHIDTLWDALRKESKTAKKARDEFRDLQRKQREHDIMIAGMRPEDLPEDYLDDPEHFFDIDSTEKAHEFIETQGLAKPNSTTELSQGGVDETEQTRKADTQGQASVGEGTVVPKLRPGEKGTAELFQGADQPFNLAGERGVDYARIHAEKEAAEQRAEEARQLAEQQQQKLFDDPQSLSDAAPAKSIQPVTVRRAISRIADRLKGAAPYQIIEDGSQYPQSVLDAAKERGITDLNRIRGVVVDGRIYLNAAAIESPSQAVGTFLHEAAAHGGVDPILESLRPGSLASLDALLRRSFPDEYAAVERQYLPGERHSETLAKVMEQLGADMATEKRSLWNKVLDYIRVTLAKYGVKNWSRADVEALLRRGLDAVREFKKTVTRKLPATDSQAAWELLEHRSIPLEMIDPDQDYLNSAIVKRYEDAIRNGEEIEPPAVMVNLKTGRFTSVDGHHRIQAYKNLGFTNIAATERAMPPGLNYEIEQGLSILSDEGAGNFRFRSRAQGMGGWEGNVANRTGGSAKSPEFQQAGSGRAEADYRADRQVWRERPVGVDEFPTARDYIQWVQGGRLINEDGSPILPLSGAELLAAMDKAGITPTQDQESRIINRDAEWTAAARDMVREARGDVRMSLSDDLNDPYTKREIVAERERIDKKTDKELMESLQGQAAILKLQSQDIKIGDEVVLPALKSITPYSRARLGLHYEEALRRGLDVPMSSGLNKYIGFQDAPRDLLNAPRFSLAPEPDAEPKKFKQFFGKADAVEGGREYTPAKWATARSAVKSQFFDGSVQVTDQSTARAWDLWEDWTSRNESANISRAVMDASGSGLGEPALLAELRTYAAKLATAGDPLLWNSLRMDASEIRRDMTMTESAQAMTGRGLSMSPLASAMKASTDSLNTVVGGMVGDSAVVAELQEEIKKLKLKIADLEKAAAATPVPGAANLDNWLKTKSGTEDAGKRRKSRAAKKESEDEESWQDKQAKKFIDKMQSEQTEWWKDKPIDVINEVIKDALTVRVDDSADKWTFVQDTAESFKALGVSDNLAVSMSEEIWIERENRKHLKSVRAREAEARRIAELPETTADQIISRLQLAQTETMKASDENAVRDFVKSALKESVSDDRGTDPGPTVAFLRPKLEALGVPTAKANELAYEIWNEKRSRRASAVAKRAVEARRREAELPAKTASNFVEKMQKAQTEWSDAANVNAVREIINASLEDDVSYNAADAEAFLAPLRAQLEAAGVPSALARTTADEIRTEKIARESRAIVKEMERVATGLGSLAYLQEAIFNAPLRLQQNPQWRAETELNFLLDAGLPEEYAVAAQKRFDAELVKTWQKALETAASKVMNGNPKFKEKAKKQPKKAMSDMEKVFRALRAQVMDPSIDWQTRLGKENGWKGLAAADYERLQDLDNMIHDPETDRHQRARYVAEVQDKLRAVSIPSHWLHTIAEAYTASALSGVPTVTVNLFSPIIANTRGLFIEIFTNPTNTTAAFKAFGDAMSNVFSEITFGLKNDAFAGRQQEYLHQIGRLKEMMQTGIATLKSQTEGVAAKTKAVLKILYGSQTLVGRTLSALDEAAKASTREFSLFLYTSHALRDAKWDRAKISAVTTSIQEVKQQVYDRALADGMTPNDARVRATDATLEAYHDAIAENLGEEAAGEVSVSSRHDSELVVGMLSENIKEHEEGMMSRLVTPLLEAITRESSSDSAMRRIMVKMVFGFVNVPFRTMKYFVQASPYGLLRSAVHYSRQAAGKDTLWKQSYGTRLQAIQRTREAVAGTVGMMLLGIIANRSGDEDKKKPLELIVTGAGPDKSDPALRDAWLKKWTPFTIHARIAGVDFKMPLGRTGESLLPMFSMAGALDDLDIRRRHLKGMKDAKDLSATAEIAGSYFYSFAQRGIFSAFTRIGDISNARQGQPLTKLAQSASYAGSALIPWNSMTQTAARVFFDPKDRSSMATALLMNSPAVMVIGKPALNALGDVIGDTTVAGKMLRNGAPIVVATKHADSPAYDLILKYGQAPSALNRKVVENGLGAKLTDEQWYNFSKARGERIRLLMERSAAGLANLKPERNERRGRIVNAEEQFNEHLDRFSKLGKEHAIELYRRSLKK